MFTLPVCLALPYCPLREIREHSSHKSSATHSCQCVRYFRVQTMVWLPGLGIFNMHTDVNPCGCTRGLYGHRRESALKGLWEQNHLPHRGLEPASELRQLFSRMLYQLSYPAPLFNKM